MGMHINRQLDVFAQRRDKVVAFLRRHDARHILDAERIAAKRFDLLAQGDEHLQIVNGAERVADTALRMAARLEAFIHGGFDVAHIVERVENADDIHSVLHTPAHKAADGIVRIMVVAQQILAA